MSNMPPKPRNWQVLAALHLLVGLLFSPPALGQPASLKDGLVGYYPFNGGVNDLSGNARNATTAGGISYGQDRFGSGSSVALFNKGRVVIKPTPINLSGDYSISFWSKLNSSAQQYVLSTGRDGASGMICGYNQSLGYTIQPAWGKAVASKYSGDVSQWHQVVYTRQGSVYSIYINGGLHVTQQQTELSLDEGELWIGQHKYPNNGYPYYLDGAMDDLRLYNRSLSSSEVKALYDYEATPPETDFKKIGLMAYYPFNGNANDESGNQQNGVMQNGAIFSSDALGNPNSAASFSGVNSSYSDEDRVSIPSSILNGRNQFTIYAQFKLLSEKEWHTIISGGSFGLLVRTDRIMFRWNSATSDAGALAAIPLNRWTTIALTQDGNVARCFVNGKQVSLTGGTPEALIIPANDLFIGGRGVGNFRYGLNGLMDNFRVYSRALSSTEVASLTAEETVPFPEFLVQPQSSAVTIGNDATFCVTLKNAAAYNYQWQRNEQNITGATLNCYTINSVTAAIDGSRYRVIVSNGAGTVISDNATLTIVTPPPPTITAQPTPKVTQEGSNITFNVVATGQGTLVYQWQLNEQNLAGANSSTLSLNMVKLNAAGRYRVLVSSQYGVTISDTVTLTVNPNPPPTIVTQPISKTPAEGTQVSLTVTATGLGTLTYQWQVNGQNIPGATSSTLVLSAVRPSVTGVYRVIVGNPYGTTISAEASILVVVTDSDSDGLSDYEELLAGTNPSTADTDGDGLSDFSEVQTHKTNPLNTDTDSDGYSDGIEVARDGNPINRSITPTGALAVFPAVDVEFYTLTGVKYQLEVSNDMVIWTTQGGVVFGNGGNQNHLVRASKSTQFWRLKAVQ